MTPSRHRRTRRYVALAVVIGLISAAAFWYWPRPRLNLLVITLDTTRADRIGCYGYAPASTPVLDALAERGVLFERAYATIPLTLPAHASMFTGLYPPEHGIHMNGKTQLPDELPTLAETLREQGYQTGAFIASFVLDSKFGLGQGFDEYGDDLTGTTYTDEALHRSRDGNVVVDEALAWLQGRDEQPLFCWVHLYDPHAPYVDHQDLFGDRFKDRPYDAEIAFVDLQIDRLLKFLGNNNLDKNTLVVVIGDHGEGLGDHHERSHGQMVYNTTMHVPWIISLPGRLAPSQRIADPVSQVDFLPTILDMLDYPLSHSVSGQSLVGLIEGATNAPRALYGESNEPLRESGWAPLRSVTTAEWKYIRTTRPELYDVVRDYNETNNLAAEHADTTAELERLLSDIESGLEVRDAANVALTSQEKRGLASLGYAAGSSVAETDDASKPLPDIKDMIVHYNTLSDLREMMDHGRDEEAIPRLEELIQKVPHYTMAVISLGDAYYNQQQLEKAAEIYLELLERDPDDALALFRLADVRQAEGRLDEAVELYLKALEFEPESPHLHYNLARTLVQLGDDRNAIPHLRTAIEQDPGYVFALIELGSAIARSGRPAEALVHFERALQYQEDSVFAHMNAAGVLAQMGHHAEVLRHLTRAAEISPEDAEIQFQLGTYLAAHGDSQLAIEHLNESLRLHPDRPAARDLIEKLQNAE